MARQVMLMHNETGAVIPFEQATRAQLDGFDYNRVIMRNGVVDKVVTVQDLRSLALQIERKFK
jgi:hypothetical protein